MRIDGPQKLVERAIFVARLYDINPAVTLAWGEEDDYSECQEMEDGSFTIIIAPWLKGVDLINAVGHEMTHVWQHVRGSLVTMHNEQRWLWNGQMHIYSGGMEDYLLKPWELEARAMEAWIEYRWRTRNECPTTKN